MQGVFFPVYLRTKHTLRPEEIDVVFALAVAAFLGYASSAAGAGFFFYWWSHRVTEDTEFSAFAPLGLGIYFVPKPAITG